MAVFQLSAVTKQERNAATTAVMDTIMAQGGWVEDVHLFSNIMTTVNFVMPANQIAGFVAALNGHGIHAEGAAPDSLKAVGDTETRCSLQLTFIHNEPDLKREIPQVPG